MIDDYDNDDFFEADDSDEPLDYEGVDEAERQGVERPHLLIKSALPMFQVLFADAVAGDEVLEAFAGYVVGELSDRFALKAAKGGAFFQEREAEGKVKNTERFQHDQNLRAHLINGMLPVLRIARQLVEWEAPCFEDWEKAVHERLFIAGYVLHDYTKIEDVKKTLRDNGFKDYDAPSEDQMPLLIEIFREWCINLGLDAFLQSLGGAEPYLEDLIYIACNTQALKGTARSGHLYRRLSLDIDSLNLITYLSRLADLIAYVAKTPRDIVAHESISKLMAIKLAPDEDLRKPIARFVYHHVAENRGLLLNFIHNAVVKTLSNEARIPLLYAPSGVVYLERHDAPEMPDMDEWVDDIVIDIRREIGKRTLETGTGSQLNKDGLRVGETFRDLFDLPEIVENSYRLVILINSNVPKYMEFLGSSGWPHTDEMPNYSKDKTDLRLRQMAEWASLIETQFEDRSPDKVNQYIDFVFERWQIEDLREKFEDLRPYQQRGVGIRHRWYWAAAYALDREAKKPEEVLMWLKELSEQLAQDLSAANLPESSKANQETWDELRNYIKAVLTVKGRKSLSALAQDELTNYVEAKVKRGKSTCAICGSDYTMREQVTSAVAFQPGVYTQRVRIGASNNKRSMCSICATEQLLRQLFVSVKNLPTGKDLEAQKVRYLSFYPSYFFSPETLKVVQRAYAWIDAIRLSNADFWRALREQDNLQDVRFWQGLDNFLLHPDTQDDKDKFQKVLRYQYGKDSLSTVFTVGFRAGFKDISETESWILPTFLAFVMAINLDIKVVASDSDIPLMLESSELSETLWFDGAHASIQSLISVRHYPETQDREAYNKIEQRSTMDVDSMCLALARLTAAYLIHLDTEYVPPKENWQRFTPIANALGESPLYVFHYLKQQERKDRPITQSKIKRYIAYAENLFNIQGEQDMSHAKELVRLYRGFYRAKSIKNAHSILRPLSVVSDALLVADQNLFKDTEALFEIAYGELYRFMDRVGKGLADGRFPKGISVEERQKAMREFSNYFVRNIFEAAFNKDVAALRGKQLNLLKSACEVLYREAQYQEWAERNEAPDDESDDN
jgi:CRISPR-associated protein Csc3